ncbi:MAG TPA: CBS domain-containing protein [Pyrinomonadaceae bacterium]|nr:CBS domain-containing protein [Pyrinomonadaceae bacterium]
MVMLSQLRRFKVAGDSNEEARLADLSVALLEGDYPPVTRLYFLNARKEIQSLPWDDVKSIDWSNRVIEVSSLEKARRESRDSMTREVLLADGILDALILDLENRRATRANDLCLEEEDAKLFLRSADTGFSALIRRLTGARFGRISRTDLLDWKYVEFLRGDPQAVGRESGRHLRIGRLPPGEIARLADPLPYLHAAELITLLADPKAADTLEAMMPERQLQVFEELEEEQALRLLALMAPDIATDLVGRLQTRTMRRYLERLPRKQAERILDLLRYPEDTVGGIMTNDFVYARGSLTVAEARDALREPLKDPDFVFLIYIVNDEKSLRLRGLISIRNLITAGDNERLEEIMDPYVTTLDPLAPAGEAAYRVIESHMAALPVAGAEGQLLGVVTVDAAVSQVAPHSWSAQAPRVFS